MKTNIWFLKGLRKFGRTEKYPAEKYAQSVMEPIVNSNATVKKFEQFKRSFYLYQVDSGTCGACNLELQALQTPHYDLNRLGLFFTNTPRHADALVIMGVYSEKMVKALENAYDAMPEPKLIIALGACAMSGGMIGKSPRLSKEAIVYIPGCPPNPYTILKGIMKAKEVSSK